MIAVKDAENIHRILIEDFGGTQGTRDKASLEAALARPYSTFDGKELYPTAADKAAALLESLAINHPFVDGNKRVSYVLMRLTLMDNGCDIEATEEEKFQLVMEVSKGNLNFDAIKEWIGKRIKG